MSRAPLRALLPALLVAAAHAEVISDGTAVFLGEGGERWRGSSEVSVRLAEVVVARHPEVKHADGVVLELAQVSMESAVAVASKTTVEALRTRGGLIQTFQLNGKNILFFGEWEDQMDGSIFWPSPQAVWDWPPPVQIDPTPSKNYTMEYSLYVNQDAKSFTLTSPISEKYNLRVSKRASMDPERAALVLENSIINTGEEIQSWAPWEVSRVRPNGMTFYATGSLPPTSGTYPPLDVTEMGGVTWYVQNQTQGWPGGKLFADTSQGWLAHTDGELVMVVCFDKIPADAAAPGDQQIEIFNGGFYVEVELQGAYVPIAPGHRLEWTQHWHLRDMPPGAAMVPGDEQLVALATSLCLPPPMSILV